MKQGTILQSKKVLCVALLTLSLGSASADARGRDDKDKWDKGGKGRSGACQETTQQAYKSCQFDVEDAYYTELAKCSNETDRSEQKDCEQEAKQARQESTQLCKDIMMARGRLCADFGGASYNPEIKPEDFLSSEETAANPNPFFPLVPGTVRKYRSGDETVTVTVTNETREILGINAMVVHDLVTINGDKVEDTEDYFAQDKEGNVWYLGEIAQNFEDGRLSDVEGSWIAGVDRAKPGIIMKAQPKIWDKYRQEFLLNEAEDIARVISLTGSETVPAITCNGNCLLTEETTPLEPKAQENKYYYPGTGFVLSVHPKTGERTELIEVTK